MSPTIDVIRMDSMEYKASIDSVKGGRNRLSIYYTDNRMTDDGPVQKFRDHNADYSLIGRSCH